MREARITKVSGPLVVAKGCLGAKMYDMVRVSEEKLIGEIVELRGEFASIQVYEETSGIGPGEPVYLMEEPLSVELGPGLISSIYDGIQRPMDIIRLKTGDFVGRGIEIPALNREKRWYFKPKVKEGDFVSEGDILGEVEETSLVIHKILVPPGVKGKILEIYEGEFKIEDKIAKIESEGKILELKMYQKWPVRRERPIKEKLTPDTPLITGQRVIDTLFPITKGGTGCIPGPFGSGKCVSGDTPVMLGDGQVKKIKEIFDENFEKGEIVEKDGEIIIYLKEPLSIFTLSGKGIAKAQTNILYKGKSDCLLRFKTRSGRLIEVTPLHRLFKITSEGQILQTMAKDLCIGDFIASVRYINCNNQDVEINPYILKKARVADGEIKKEIAGLLRLLIRQRRLGELGLSIRDIYQFAYGPNLPTVELVEKIYKFLKLKLPYLKTLRATTSNKVITIPSKITPELAEFMGLFIAGGNIRADQAIVFTNSDERLLKRFLDLGKYLFGVEARIVRQKSRSSAVIINRKILVDFLKNIFSYRKADNKQIPSPILMSSNLTLASFLRGYFLGDGSFSQGEIEFTTVSKDLQIGLSYLLTRLGIFHVLSKKLYRRKEYYRILIRSIENLKLFYEAVKVKEYIEKIEMIKDYIDSKISSYSSYDIVPLSKKFVLNLYRNSAITYTILKNRGIEISNYTTNQENMSRRIFKEFVNCICKNEDDNLMRLNNLLNEIFCDRIVSIEEIKGPVDVYDFSIPETENFVGGWGGVILHNTVLLHEVAKWSDADIIVYCACGERGNEVADLLLTLPELKDPRSGRPLMERTVVVANTSNMPVAAREASIYTAITIAEYFRDMGYTVALMADSTSRWAEALREISGRLEEMPGEEGYPAYLSTRIAEFYERAGKVICLGNDNRIGSLTAMGAVSPPGGDISDPVVQATLRVVKTFWSLDDRLASSRHFPAINWLLSYSLYHDNIKEFLTKNISEDFIELKRETMRILEEEAELLEIARLVGVESLSSQERLTLETAKSIREDFLHQNAFHEIDTYTSLKKQYLILKTILELHRISSELLKEGRNLKEVLDLSIREKIPKIKYILEENLDEFEDLEKELKALR